MSDKAGPSNDAEEQSRNTHQHTVPIPPEPEDVDALLAESLRAQSERDFTWKEPERKPRWWERAEGQEESTGAVTPERTAEVASSSSRDNRRVRLGSVVFALISLLLAGWVVASVAFGITVEPLVVGLVICSLAGMSLIVAGLRPKPGTRI
ncbi:hypothetical protein FEF26_13350 [Nesterenkonia salmonea]|uniref:Uncharacterized protein n=1 Tax=Nesterenkonia salmonea TaxID=1804987 RepID=A0A5R9B9L3_9MICC|nr:hypothetical protein [Nesterenkonia salmonea]TLP93517.1 hypothetical protein FEF26_13350 [Nesterenkonia salmonea]